MPRKANNELRKSDITLLQRVDQDKQEQIRKALVGDNNTLEGITTYTKIAYALSVPVSVVRAVARSMRNELQSDELARKDELRRAIMQGAITATDQLLTALEAGEIRATQLPTVVGILVDKYKALADDDAPTGLTAIVAGDMSQLASSILQVLQNAHDRAKAIDVEVTDVSSDTESDT